MILLHNFKLVVVTALIGRYSNRNRSSVTTRPRKRKSHEPIMIREVPTCMPEFHWKQMRCHYCKNESSDLKSFLSCQKCVLYLCLANHLLFYITISLLIIYLLENRLFLRKFSLCLLCSQICLRNLNLTKNT